MIKTTSFWLDDTNDIDVLTGETIQPGKDYHKMAATLRAVGNFVQIVTGKSIPVTYSTKDESYTDGKAVVLSGNIKAKDYDPTVGLALHEGSHCALTDFDILPKLMERNSNLIPRGFRQMILNKYFVSFNALFFSEIKVDKPLPESASLRNLSLWRANASTVFFIPVN